MSGYRGSETSDGRDAPLFSEHEWQKVVAELRLSPRRAEVVALILRGMRDKQIASALGMKLPTVRTHIRHTFVQLDLTDRVELILHIFALLRRSDENNH